MYIYRNSIALVFDLLTLYASYIRNWNSLFFTLKINMLRCKVLYFLLWMQTEYVSIVFLHSHSLCIILSTYCTLFYLFYKLQLAQSSNPIPLGYVLVNGYCMVIDKATINSCSHFMCTCTYVRMCSCMHAWYVRNMLCASYVRAYTYNTAYIYVGLYTYVYYMCTIRLNIDSIHLLDSKVH